MRWRRLIVPIFFVVIVLLCIAGWLALQRDANVWVSKVVISGVPLKEQKAVQTVIRPYVNKTVVNLPLQPIRNALLGFSWAADVELQRVWPKTLQIVFRPQRLLALWNGQFVLNAYGERFRLKGGAKDLPTLYGPVGRQIQVLSVYQQAQAILKGLNVQIEMLRLNDNGNWQLVLEDGMDIQLGKAGALTRLKRFVKVYFKVFPKTNMARDRHVDLRYPNGMAVSRSK
jgi:cell division protein FtsQ